MRQSKLLGVALLAILVLAAIPASSASAATPEILPSSTGERAWKGNLDGDTLEFVSFLPIACTAAEGLGTLLQANR